MPPVLKELMRHESVETTMQFYVGINAEATADELWRVAGNIPGNNATCGNSAVQLDRRIESDRLHLTDVTRSGQFAILSYAVGAEWAPWGSNPRPKD